MLVCICKGVSDRALRAAIDDGAATVGQLARQTDAGTDCGTCVCELKQMLAERRARGVRDAARLLASAASVVS